MGSKGGCEKRMRPHILQESTPFTCLAYVLQVYGFGKSEEFIGEFMKETGTQPIIATKVGVSLSGMGGPYILCALGSKYIFHV
jgi:hypothetical protein